MLEARQERLERRSVAAFLLVQKIYGDKDFSDEAMEALVTERSRVLALEERLSHYQALVISDRLLKQVVGERGR